MRPSLRRAYRATIYSTGTQGSGRFDLRPGDFHPAFDAWLLARQCTSAVIITAWNPCSRQQGASHNNAANAMLMTWLLDRDYHVLSAENRAENPAWTEQSLAVLDLPLQLAAALGRRWRQKAILVAQRGRRAGLFSTSRTPIDESSKFF